MDDQRPPRGFLCECDLCSDHKSCEVTEIAHLNYSKQSTLFSSQMIKFCHFQRRGCFHII